MAACYFKIITLTDGIKHISIAITVKKITSCMATIADVLKILLSHTKKIVYNSPYWPRVMTPGLQKWVVVNW